MNPPNQALLELLQLWGEKAPETILITKMMFQFLEHHFLKKHQTYCRFSTISMLNNCMNITTLNHTKGALYKN